MPVDLFSLQSLLGWLLGQPSCPGKASLVALAYRSDKKGRGMAFVWMRRPN